MTEDQITDPPPSSAGTSTSPRTCNRGQKPGWSIRTNTRTTSGLPPATSWPPSSSTRAHLPRRAGTRMATTTPRKARRCAKSFLRAPVNFKYISSNFNPRRPAPGHRQDPPPQRHRLRGAGGTPIMAAGLRQRGGRRLQPVQRQLRLHQARRQLRHQVPASPSAPSTRAASEAGCRPSACSAAPAASRARICTMNFVVGACTRTAHLTPAPGRDPQRSGAGQLQGPGHAPAGQAGQHRAAAGPEQTGTATTAAKAGLDLPQLAVVGESTRRNHGERYIGLMSGNQPGWYRRRADRDEGDQLRVEAALRHPGSGDRPRAARPATPGDNESIAWGRRQPGGAGIRRRDPGFARQRPG